MLTESLNKKSEENKIKERERKELKRNIQDGCKFIPLYRNVTYRAAVRKRHFLVSVAGNVPCPTSTHRVYVSGVTLETKNNRRYPLRKGLHFSLGQIKATSSSDVLESIELGQRLTRTSIISTIGFQILILSYIYIYMEWLQTGSRMVTGFTHLQLVTTINRKSLRIYTVYSSLYYALNLFKLLCLHQSSGNGFQRQTFHFLWVPKLSPCFS
jgi:hypothetical protein